MHSLLALVQPFNGIFRKSDPFLRDQDSVVPFFENSEPTQKLYFVKLLDDCYDIFLGTPDYRFPELT